MSDEDEIKLNNKEKIDLTIQTALQLIPSGIGAAISNIYFGIKQEKRFKRLERFYSEIAQELKSLQSGELIKINDKISLLNNYDKEAFVFIFEQLNDKIEREFASQKINILKSYLKSTLRDPVNGNNFDKRKFFLDAIGSMTIFECEILGYIYNQKEFIKVESIIKGGIDKYEILGSINRLKSFGFIITYQFSYATADAVKGHETGFDENIEISPLGREFGEFCLTTQ